MPTDPGGFSVDPGVLGQRLSSSFGQFFSKIGGIVTVAANAATGADELIAKIQAIVQDWEDMKQNLKDEVEKLKNFEFDPKWKTRVINVPIAIDQIRELLDEVFNQTRDKIEDIIQPLKAVHDFELLKESATATAGAQGDQPSKLAKALETAGEIVSFVQKALSDVQSSFDSAKDLTALFEDITDKIKNAESLFLQQGNSRQRKSEKAFVRVGKLHRSSAA